MKRSIAVSLIACCTAVSDLGAWRLSEFFIYLWGTPPIGTEAAKAQALAAAGLTVVDGNPGNIEVLAAQGLKAMVHKPTPDVARAMSGNPAVWGYHLADEPYPEEQFVSLADQKRRLAAADPNHPAFVNMLSTTGEFLRTYMAVVRPELLSFDYYQWWWGSDRYFEKLEQFREAALAAGIPLAVCVEVSANPGVERGDLTYLPDNARKLRQSVYTSLAYGVKGIEWFSATLLFEPKSTTLSAAGRDVAQLNAELRRLGPHLVPLRSLDVFHTPPLAAGTRTAPKEHWVQLIGEEGRPGLVQGMFEDEEGTDYMLVARGEWETISSTSFVGFTFVIEPGDGELFRITTKLQ